MRRPAIGILAVLLLTVALVPGAAAFEVNWTDVSTFGVTAPEGYAIYQVNLDGLDAGVTTITLDAFGEPYIVEINCTRSFLFNSHWDFIVSITYPNGTVVSESLGTLSIGQEYKVRLQYFTPDLIDTFLDVDIYIDILPKSVSFMGPVFPSRSYLIFHSVTVTAPDEMSYAKVYIEDGEGLSKIVDPTYQITSWTGSFFSWAWGSILWFVEKIPGVGPYFAIALDILVVILGELIFYLKFFFIEEPEVTVCLVEIFCFGEAMIHGGSMGTLLRRAAENHVAIFKFLLWLAEWSIGMVMLIIRTIADVVKALKLI